MNQRESETRSESGVNLHFGLIKEIDAAAPLFRVLLPELDDMLTQWLPMLADVTQDDKDYQIPDIGSQVALLLDPTGETGVILGCIYSEADPPPVQNRDKWHKRFKDGTRIEYDRAAHKLLVDAQGEITVEATGPVNLKAQTVNVQALTVNAEASVSSKISAPLIELDGLLVKTPSLLVAGLLQFVPPPPPTP